MKNILLSIYLLCLTISTSLAQTSPCTSALPSYQFQQRLREVKNATSETERLEISKKFLAQYCITSEQAKQLAEAFANDFDRLDFAKLAYMRTIDKGNFYDVYDAFGYFSNVFRLHDYIASTKQPVLSPTIGAPSPVPNPYPNATVNFPSYQYPDAQAYQGAIICQNPMDETAFLGYYQQVKAQAGEQAQCDAAISYAQQQCFTTAQFMKLTSIFEEDEPKLDLLKRGLQYVYDVENYYFAEQVFKSFVRRQDFKRFYDQSKGQLSTTGTGTGLGDTTSGGSYPCQVDEPSLAVIRQKIEQERFNNKRLNVARQLVQEKGACFTSAQIKLLADLFSFETSRLEMAKFGYDYALDKEAYLNTVSEAFTFSTSKTSLERYIQQK